MKNTAFFKLAEADLEKLAELKSENNLYELEKKFEKGPIKKVMSSIRELPVRGPSVEEQEKGVTIVSQ